jgi:hypothetical protein
MVSDGPCGKAGCVMARCAWILVIATTGCVAVNDYGIFHVADGGAERDAGTAMRDAGRDAGGGDDAGSMDAGSGCTSDAECARETRCDLTSGRCVPICQSGEVSVARIDPVVHFLVPNSGSMTNQFGTTGTAIWPQVVSVLTISGGAIERLQGSVRFGLTLYTGDEASGQCPITTTIAPAIGNAAPIQGAMRAATPIADTPTADVLATLSGTTVADQGGGAAYVHFVPNVPDTCAVPNPQIGDPEAIAAVSAASAMGIRSHVIDLSDMALAYPPQLAQAGGGQVFVARDPATLTAALEAAVQAAVSCRVRLTTGSLPDAPCDATVTLAGTVLACQAADGWRSIDATTIEITGAACAQMLADASLAPTVSVACP